MSSFILKIIACITMFIDHLGYAIFGKFSYFNIIGRIAFPIFAYQISEGYSHTKDLKKYCIKLGLFALISQIPFSLFKSIISTEFGLNIFFTLFLGLLAIICYEKSNNKVVRFIPAILISVLAHYLNTDYGAFGILTIFSFHIFKQKKLLMNLSFIILVVIKYGISIYNYSFNYLYVVLALFTILPLVFINLYNKKQGYKIKYFLYIFYPTHLLLLYLFYIIK